MITKICFISFVIPNTNSCLTYQTGKMSCYIIHFQNSSKPIRFVRTNSSVSYSIPGMEYIWRTIVHLFLTHTGETHNQSMMSYVTTPRKLYQLLTQFIKLYRNEYLQPEGVPAKDLDRKLCNLKSGHCDRLIYLSKSKEYNFTAPLKYIHFNFSLFPKPFIYIRQIHTIRYIMIIRVQTGFWINITIINARIPYSDHCSPEHMALYQTINGSCISRSSH